MITHKEIFGWFDANAEKFYSMMIDRFPDGSRFLEIGAYMGQSTCFMAQEIKRKNRRICFDCIDHFKGNEDHQNQLAGRNLYHLFLDNMKRAGTLDTVHVYPMDANVAANLIYDDESLDFVFIDADHSYECVKNDIARWMPKVKKGGVISGDDYVRQHPGVIQAVNETFQNNFELLGRNWYHAKG